MSDHPWKFCPRCGERGKSTDGAGGNDRCYHCPCGFVECADAPHQQVQFELAEARADLVAAEQERDRLRAESVEMFKFAQARGAWSFDQAWAAWLALSSPSPTPQEPEP